MAAFDIQLIDKKQYNNEDSHENIKLQVIVTEPGMQMCSYTPKEKDTSQDIVVDRITEEDNTDPHKAILGAPKAGVALRRATVGVPNFSKDQKSSETPDPVKLRKVGFHRTNEPKHALLRGLTQVYYSQ